jgi:hypothetical protein
MASSSLTGTPRTSPRPSDDDTALLGPSDNSDSGSDTLGQRADLAQPDDSPSGPALEPLTGGTDAAGTGERADAEGDLPHDGADILPDRIIGPGGHDLSAAEVQSLSGSFQTDDDGEDDIDPEDDLA